MKRYLWAPVVCTAIVFALLAWAVRNDYGWNWDESQHLIRGQAYLRYLMGGSSTSDSVTPYQGRQSIYEHNPFDITWLTKVIGHPPTTDIILASVNQVLYKRFGLLGDMESYHIYGLAVTFAAALVVGIWSYQISGIVGGILSVISFYTLPLLWSEQHFNFKDPAIAAYNTIFLYFFWWGVTRSKWLLLLLAAVIGGISLGTKLNIVFVAPALCLWLCWYLRGKIKAVYVLYAGVPVIMTAVLYLTYPLLWTNFIAGVQSIVDYYKQIGGSRCPYIPATGFWFSKCLDVATARLFLVTIPVPTLVLACIGSVIAVVQIGKHKLAPLLWLLVLTGIFLRVVLPINSLYGGSLRQVLEFIGPMSLLVGFGAGWLVREYPRLVTAIILFVVYIPVVISMWRLHPNENLYTNAIQRMLWPRDIGVFVNGTVSYGNAYKQGIDWINSNAHPNALVSLVTGLESAVPAAVFRPDIQYGLTYWSSYEKKGEYLIELVDTQSHQAQLFPYKYATNILVPVYERRTEGLPIVRVWQNDAAHTKSGLKDVQDINIVHTIVLPDEVILELKQTERIRNVTIHTPDTCRPAIMNSYLLVSTDGVTYRRMYETVEEMNRSNTTGPVTYPFAGEDAKFIKVFTYNPEECDLSHVRFAVSAFR